MPRLASPAVAAGQYRAGSGVPRHLLRRHQPPRLPGLRQPFRRPARQFRNEQQFLSGYHTTTDSDPALVALAPASMGEWAATVTFISHQSPADSATIRRVPAGISPCTLNPAGTPISSSSRPRATSHHAWPAGRDLSWPVVRPHRVPRRARPRPAGEHGAGEARVKHQAGQRTLAARCAGSLVRADLR